MKAKFNSLWWADEAQRAECMRVINVAIEHIAQHVFWDASIAERVYNKAFDAQQRRKSMVMSPTDLVMRAFARISPTDHGIYFFRVTTRGWIGTAFVN